MSRIPKFEESFASHPKSQFWCYEKNGNVKPEDIFKYTRKKFWFKCNVCNHNFEMILSNVSRNNQWCSYCGNKKLCNCQECFQKSFASHPKSQFWCYEKNHNIKPSQVFKRSNSKYWLKCFECSHYFQSVLFVIYKNHWCPFCSNQKLCDCQVCLKKSFSSHPKSQFWNNDKNGKVNPSQVFRASHKQYWFNCDKCYNIFKMSLDNISCDNKWCPKCKINKPEMRLTQVCENHPNIIQFEKKRIPCVDIFNGDKMRNLVPDMIITLSNNLKLMVEIDGEQHFNPLHKINTLLGGNFQDQIYRDLCKNRYARDNGMSLLRISYKEFDKIEDLINLTIEEILKTNNKVIKCSNPDLYNSLRKYKIDLKT